MTGVQTCALPICVSGTGAVGTVGHNLDIIVSGVTGTAAVNNVSISISELEDVTGVQGTGAVDGFITYVVTKTLTGVEATGAVGTVTTETDEHITPVGVAGTGAVGTIALVYNSNISVTGVEGVSAVQAVTTNVIPLFSGVQIGRAHV